MSRIVVAGANHWGGSVTTGSQQYARLFARNGWEVAYLSDPVSPFHLLRARSWLFNREKFRLWLSGGRRDLDGSVFAYTHFTLLPIFNAPLLRSELAVRHSLDFALPRLPAKLAREGFGRPDLLWIEHLVFEGLLERMRPAASVYRMADDPDLFPDPYPPALMRRLPAMIDRVDWVVVTARLLEERVRALGKRQVLYLPNGVDPDHFAGPHAEPRELRDVPRPRILYVGSLEEWFDTELIERAARAHPSYQFVIIGPVRIPLDALRALPNVHVLGPRPYAAVPAYMAACDAGLIPFRRNRAMEAVHPIKVYEYLACGLPVVSTSWEELRLMAAPITIAGSAAEFVDAIEAAVRHPGDAAGRRAYARANSWASRFSRLSLALDGGAADDAR